MPPKPMKFTVEFLGPKGWEIGHESDDPELALAYYEETVQDSRIDPDVSGARLTAEVVEEK